MGDILPIAGQANTTHLPHLDGIFVFRTHCHVPLVSKREGGAALKSKDEHVALVAGGPRI